MLERQTEESEYDTEAIKELYEMDEIETRFSRQSVGTALLADDLRRHRPVI